MNITSAVLAVVCLVSVLRMDAKEAPMEAPPGVSILRDLDYLAPGRAEKLDLDKPSERTRDERSPAVVIIHGGGWTSGDKNREREFITGTSLAKAGYVCVSINYETAAGRRWPNNLHDCKNAVRWLRVNAEKLQVDPDRIGVIGGSAGGHLALMVAYTGNDDRLSPEGPYAGVSDKVGACVDMYGITNLLTRKETEKDGTPTDVLKDQRLFSGSREKVPAKWRNASPVSHVDKDSPPTLIYHGTADDVADRDQSKELHQVLQAAGVESTLRMVPGAGHAWSLKTKDFDFTGEVVAFFNKHLGKKATAKRDAPKQRPNVFFISVDDLNYKVTGELLKRGGGYGGKHFYPFPKEGSQITNHYGKSHSDGNSLCAGPLDREDMPGGKMFDEMIAEWAIEKLNEKQEEPFFLAVGFVRPHVPFTAPRKYFDLYDPEKIVIPKVPEDEMSDISLMGKSIAYETIKGGDNFAVVNLSDTYWRELVHGYLACVSFVDDQIGRVIDTLEKSPHAENTIVVPWSDHGQHLGEKNHWRKQALWEESTRVPLFFKTPGTKGTKCDEAVTLLDIYPTLVDLCDLLIEEHKKWLPKKDVLPAGSKE